MTKASDNKYPKVYLEERLSDGSDTTTPAADHRALFLGEDGSLHLKDSAAAVTAVGGGGGGTAFTGARSHRGTSAFNVPDDTDTPMEFNDETSTSDFDEGPMHSTSSNPERFTAVTAGYYDIEAQISWDSNGTGGRDIAIVRNGTDFLDDPAQASVSGADSANAVQKVHGTIHLAIGDYVYVNLYQDSGTTRTVLATPGSYLLIEFRGAA